ncbi:MAG TPA: hypothetical protein VFB36_01025 [Nevskiaceae bacterium]|nr:hypothetical protein [Nevskiaceae bacterium]
MKHAARCTAALLALTANCAAAQGQGHDRPWPGIAHHECGADLHVIGTAGIDQVFYPPETFFAQFETTQVNQGEQLRRAVPLPTLLMRFEAKAVEFLGCGDKRRSYSAGSLESEGALVVLTGKGLLKVVGKAAEGGYSNVVTELKQIKFEAPAKQPDAAPAKQPEVAPAKRGGPPPSP